MSFLGLYLWQLIHPGVACAPHRQPFSSCLLGMRNLATGCNFFFDATVNQYIRPSTAITYYTGLKRYTVVPSTLPFYLQLWPKGTHGNRQTNILYGPGGHP